MYSEWRPRVSVGGQIFLTSILTYLSEYYLIGLFYVVQISTNLLSNARCRNGP
jgi:hypothetical protein